MGMWNLLTCLKEEQLPLVALSELRGKPHNQVLEGRLGDDVEAAVGLLDVRLHEVLDVSRALLVVIGHEVLHLESML